MADLIWVRNTCCEAITVCMLPSNSTWGGIPVALDIRTTSIIIASLLEGLVGAAQFVSVSSSTSIDDSSTALYKLTLTFPLLRMRISPLPMISCLQTWER